MNAKQNSCNDTSDIYNAIWQLPLPGYLMVYKIPLKAKKGQAQISYTGNITEKEFQFRFGAGELAKRPTLSCLYFDKRLSDALIFLASERYIVHISGRVTYGEFLVDEIHVVGKDEDDEDEESIGFGIGNDKHARIEDNLFQFVMNTLVPRDDGIQLERPILSSMVELHFFYKCCKSILPASIRTWAAQSLDDYHRAFSDERRHIQAALKNVLNIDWTPNALELPALETIQEALDQEFFGLNGVKNQILEIAAQIKHTKHVPKYGILLVGPAGTGKTSIAKAISKLINWPQVMLDLSVISDHDTLAGSSRIYSNGRPGAFMTGLSKARTSNVVVILNEIDKCASSKDSGKPIDAILSMLDGQGFTDNFTEVTIPTNHMVFIATANDIQSLSQPILDRFYIIQIPPYSKVEKEIIFDSYVFPKLLKENRIHVGDINLTPNAKELLIGSYSSGPGIREIERQAERLLTHYLKQREMGGQKKVMYDENSLRTILGHNSVLFRSFASNFGQAFTVITTEKGVTTLPVQAMTLPSEGKLEVINFTASQTAYIQNAYYCAMKIIPEVAEQKIVVSTPTLIANIGCANEIGCAVVMAIISAVRRYMFSQATYFIGGTDILGNLYIDEQEIDQIISSLEEREENDFSVYAPYGTSRLVYKPHKALHLIEAKSISTFQSLLVSRNI